MGSAQSARRIQPGGLGRPARVSADPRLRLPSAPLAGAGRGGRAGRGPPPGRLPAPVGRISPVAVRRDRLRVGWEGPVGRWLAAARRRVLQPPGSSSRRIPGPRERTAAAPSPVAASRTPSPAAPPLFSPPPLAGGGGGAARVARRRRRGGPPSGGRAPQPPARLSTGADCPQCAPTASRRRAGCGRAWAPGVRGDVGYPPDPS